jgi:iron-sulfur cluster repair protein YtfE (RIC family)
VSTLSTLIQYSALILSWSNKARERNKKNVNWKGRSEIIPIIDDVILYLTDHRNSIRKLLNLINTFSKVAGYKISIEKSVAFLYTNLKKNMLSKKSRKQFHLQQPQKIIKYLKINLNKEVKASTIKTVKHWRD